MSWWTQASGATTSTFCSVLAHMNPSWWTIKTFLDVVHIKLGEYSRLKSTHRAGGVHLPGIGCSVSEGEQEGEIVRKAEQKVGEVGHPGSPVEGKTYKLPTLGFPTPPSTVSHARITCRSTSTRVRCRQARELQKDLDCFKNYPTC